MLEIPFIQDNQSLYYEPATFHLTQLENGNYALSNNAEHFRLKHVLSNWTYTHSLVQIPEKH